MRHQISLLGGASVVALLASFGCSFPDYQILGAPLGGGGSGGAAGSSAQPGGSGGDFGAGTAGVAGNAGATGGGAPSAGNSGATPGGASGDGGEAGSREPPPVSKKCADYTSLPADDCTCADDATHAYIFCSLTRPFSTAAAKCNFSQAHLASVESQGEDAFIQKAANAITTPSQFQYFWIGASTIGSHGVWHWTDGSVFWTGGALGTPNGDAYFNWRTDSPQNTATDSCAFSDDQGWQDGDCTQNRPYVCEAN